ncbi:MAG TPA: hypothetical protein VN861_18990 [Candidatus Acidoferrales bacterium]|nr:hypothetical protein [Candidatus Acidoferrales bacterium]
MKLPGYTAESSLGRVQPQSNGAIPISFPPCTRDLLECFAGDQGGCIAFFNDHCYAPGDPAPGGPICSASHAACVFELPGACDYFTNCHDSGPIGGGDGGGGSTGRFKNRVGDQ